MLGNYQDREALLTKGSSNPGGSCCLHNAYHGCPEMVPYSAGLAKERRTKWGLSVERE
jgi:hypothetical protein